MSAGACWRFGPRDADGLLQPSAFPWGVDAFAEGLPTAPIGANQPRFEEALGRLLARAWIVIALDYVPECGQAPAEVATDLVADAQFVTPPEALTADERWRWERVTHGAMIELAEFVLAGLGGGCAQAVATTYGPDSWNAEADALFSRGERPRPLWAQESAREVPA